MGGLGTGLASVAVGYAVAGGMDSSSLLSGSLSSPSNKIWKIDIISDNFSNEWNEGPSLNEPRYRHACGKMTLKGKTILVVVGGRNKDSVELLDTSVLFTEQKWIKG